MYSDCCLRSEVSVERVVRPSPHCCRIRSVWRSIRHRLIRKRLLKHFLTGPVFFGPFLDGKFSCLFFHSRERFMIWLKNSSRLLIKREPYILTRPGLLADTAYVRTISRIDLDNLALVDEQRSMNFRTSLYGLPVSRC